MKWYFIAWKKYADFKGRAIRIEYWCFVLIHTVVSFIVSYIDLVGGFVVSDGFIGIGVLGSLYGLASFIPGLAVTVRRLHDSGRSGWWLLIVLIPLIFFEVWFAALILALICTLVLVLFLTFDSQPGENKYGPNPAKLAK